VEDLPSACLQEIVFPEDHSLALDAQAEDEQPLEDEDRFQEDQRLNSVCEEEEVLLSWSPSFKLEEQVVIKEITPISEEVMRKIYSEQPVRALPPEDPQVPIYRSMI
jgi:hypothetical protein